MNERGGKMPSIQSVKRFANAPHVTLALLILRKLSSLLLEGERFAIHGHSAKWHFSIWQSF